MIVNAGKEAQQEEASPEDAREEGHLEEAHLEDASKEGQQEQVCDMDPIAAPRVRQVPSLSRLHSLLLDVFCRQGATRT